jgi:hydrogenase nickel incorporation protein HypA/HybF
MHELPVTQGILDVALEAARGAGAGRILAINLVIGDLSSIIDDSVQFYFDILSRDTAAAGAALRFERPPAEASCLDCGHRLEATIPLTPVCPACGSVRLAITGGREFRVESIEVDDGSSGSS